MSTNLRPLATLGLIVASCFWACEPDLGALSASYQAASSGAGGTAAANNGGTGNHGTGGAGGTTTTGGTGGNDHVTGGTGGEVMPAGGAAGEAGAAGQETTGGTSGSGGTGTTQPSCSDGVTDEGETDVDCGGSSKCDRCAEGLRCTSNNDCDQAFCKSGRCTVPTCADGVKNQDETGKDCGGSCAPCPDGTACGNDDDCTGDYCDDGVCTDHCTSGVKDADETDKDCGGASCDPCADTKHCSTASDCTSFVCNNNICDVPTCSDSVKNQDEGDVDCGGACTSQQKWCSASAHEHCNVAADCDSSVCTAGKCGTDIVIPVDDVIDNFEDFDLILPATNGRQGNWYGYGDGTTGSVQTAAAVTIPGARGEYSFGALHTTGSGFTSWGCGIGADLNNGGGAQGSKAPYNASFDAGGGTMTPYAGITFWARSDAGPLSVSAVFPDGDTDAAGGICNQDPAPGGTVAGVCDHHYLASVQLGTDWQRFTVLFADLTLEAGGIPKPTSFDPTRLVSVQFRILPGTMFDFWVDDVAFVRPQ